MLVSNVESIERDNYCELRARIETNSLRKTFELFYRVSRDHLEFMDTNNGDPFVAAMLLPAMRLGEPLHVSIPVSERLLHSAYEIQSLYHEWDKTLSQITITAPARIEHNSTAKTSPYRGLFFSLGVDSFYVLLRNLTTRSSPDKITHLILVHGFDIYYGRGNSAVFAAASSSGSKVAKSLGTELVSVATNIRDFSDPLVDWGKLYHGAALASIGLVFEHAFKTIYVAASYPTLDLHPWGSHPQLDPLWSTERTRFVHEGCEAGRVDKTRFIARFPIAMETLRVCFFNASTEYNCGCCEKCIRTMIGLHVAGGLQKCKTLPHKIDINKVRNLSLTWVEKPFIQDLLENLGNSEFDLELTSALRHALSRMSTHQETIEAKLREIAVRRIGGVVASGDHRFFDQNKDGCYYESVLAMMESSLTIAGFKTNGIVLDVGCGCGTFVKACLNRGLDAVGLDPEQDFLEIAKMKGVGSSVIRAVGESLPFREESVDIVTSNSVLEHVQNPGKVVRESFRLLKPNGVLWLNFPDYATLYHEGHYGLFWLPLMPKRLAKLYVRLMGRTNTEYLDSIQYVTRRTVRRCLDRNARVVDLQNFAASEKRNRDRTYCRDRISNPQKIETKRFRRIANLLRRLRIGDRALCWMCEFICLAKSPRESANCLLPSLVKELLPKRGNVVWIIEKRT